MAIAKLFEHTGKVRKAMSDPSELNPPTKGPGGTSPAGNAATRKGFSNPALKALGIPTIRLPSRNWVIFWSVLTVTISGVVYDKYQQKQIIKKYSDSVKPQAKQKMNTNEVSRKITVFVAPPPNDYLDTSLKLYRRYIKPILFYAGLEYEVIDEDKQGVIRNYVANEIRKLRKQQLDIINDKRTSTAGSSNPVAASAFSAASENDEKLQTEESVDNGKEFKRNFDYRDLIGIFYKTEKPRKIINKDSLATDPKLTGGVICLGRGAYKEYINGLHEGLLGPLEEPEVKDQNIKNDGSIPQKECIETKVGTDKTILEDDTVPEGKKNGERTETNDGAKSNENSDNDEEEAKNVSAVPKAYITPEHYRSAEFPPQELHTLLPIIRDPNTNVPIYVHQPVLMIPVPNLMGILNTPQRISRFYQKRKFAESVCSQVTKLVNQEDIRDFEDPQDLALGIEEERDWPASWIKQGEKKQSEWIKPLYSDKRVTEMMSVFNPKQPDDSMTEE